MKKRFVFVILLLGVLLTFFWYRAHSDQNRFVNDPPDPGLATPLPQNPDQANKPKDLDPGLSSDKNNSNQASTSGVWVCAQDASADCQRVCRSSGYAASGKQSVDPSVIKTNCPDGQWGLACQCDVN